MKVSCRPRLSAPADIIRFTFAIPSTGWSRRAVPRRVVHHALLQHHRADFRADVHRGFVRQLRGKGTHRALERAQALARSYAYVLQCDAEQFFPSVDHTILRTAWPQDRRSDVLWLIGRILDSGVGVLASEYVHKYFPATTCLRRTVRAGCRSAT